MSSPSPTPPIINATNSAKHTTTPLQKGTTTTPVQTRTDLSPLYRLLRLCIRPLRPRLVGIKPLNLAGSPRLTSRPSSHYGVTISERVLQVASTAEYPLTQLDEATNTQKLWLYDLVPKSLPESRTKREDGLGSGLEEGKGAWWTHTIYYFAGGGFQAPASAEHWKLTARLAKDLAPSRIRVVMVSYPLAPKSPAKHALPLLRAWLAQTLTSLSDDETISLMGDSAGGNVVLSLAFWWSRRLACTNAETEEVRRWKKLVEVLVMSPPCDFRDVNPAIEEADRVDPVLTEGVTGGAADAWCEGWEEKDDDALMEGNGQTTTSEPLDPQKAKPPPSATKPNHKSTAGKNSPSLSLNLQSTASFTALRDSGLIVHGVIGTADRLAPDGLVFMGRCVESGVAGDWLVWEGQMHCFALTVCYGVLEGREGYGWVKERVGGLGR